MLVQDKGNFWEPPYKNPQTQIHLAFTSPIYVCNSYSKESFHEIKLNFKSSQEIQIVNSGSEIDSKICYSRKKNCLCETTNDHICWSANSTSRKAHVKLINEKAKLWMKWMHIISLSMDVCAISLCDWYFSFWNLNLQNGLISIKGF
jgi:hypothetical protein